MKSIINCENTIGSIVLGGHIQGLGIIRYFGKKNIPTLLIDNSYINIARHSKYCKEFFVIKDSELYDFLTQSEILNKYEKWVIFPTNDFHVKLLSQNKAYLEKKFVLAIDDWNYVNIFYNKINTYKVLQETSVNLPKTFFPENNEDLKNCTIPFPVIIKPAVMHEFYRQTKTKVFVCKNEGELINKYKQANEHISSSEIMIQEIIPGSYKTQYSACFFSVKGSPIVTMLGKRCRQHPLTFGNATTYAETLDYYPDYYKNALEILEKTKYTGLCEIEFIKDLRDNTFKFLEVNPRTWKWHSIANKAGVDFLGNFFNYLLNKKYNSSFVWEKASFRHRTTDIPTCLKIISNGEKCSTNKSNIQYAVWDKKDIFPSLFEIFYLPFLLLKR